MAACVVAIYPILFIYQISLATENWFLVLVLSSYLVFLKAKETIGRNIAFWKKLGLFASAGILLGITCLTRSVAEKFAVFAVIWVWFFLKECCMAIVVLAAVGIVIFPWIVRNSLLYGRLTGIESTLGYDLYIGYHPDGTGTFQYPQSLYLMTIINDSQRDAIGLEKTREFIEANPARVPYLVARRAGYFFWPGRANPYIFLLERLFWIFIKKFGWY